MPSSLWALTQSSVQDAMQTAFPAAQLVLMSLTHRPPSHRASDITESMLLPDSKHLVLPSRFYPSGGSRWHILQSKWAPAQHTLHPCGFPHAVVLVGGYERVDLLKSVVPRLHSVLPSIASLRRGASSVSGSGVAVRRTSTVRGCRRVPSYMQKGGVAAPDQKIRVHERSRRSECSSVRYLGGDTLELQLVLDRHRKHSAGSVHEKEEEFSRLFFPGYVTFGSPDVDVRQLSAEALPQRRALMRGSFGYSYALLRDSLPPPVVSVVHQFRDWETAHASLDAHRDPQLRMNGTTRRSDTCLSSAVVVSTIMHMLADVPKGFFTNLLSFVYEERRRRHLQQTDDLISSVLQRAGQFLDAPLAVDGGETVRHEASLFRAAVESLLLAGVVELLLCYREGKAVEPLQDVLHSNYFLPAESFSFSLDWAQWMDTRGRYTPGDHCRQSCITFVMDRIAACAKRSDTLTSVER